MGLMHVLSEKPASTSGRVTLVIAWAVLGIPVGVLIGMALSELAEFYVWAETLLDHHSVMIANEVIFEHHARTMSYSQFLLTWSLVGFIGSPLMIISSWSYRR